MLGYSALGTAALGTDGGTYLESAVSGVSSAAVAGALSGDHTSVQLGAGIGIGAIGSFATAQSLLLAGVSTAVVASASVAAPKNSPQSASAISSVGSIAMSLGAQPAGASTAGAAGQLAEYLTKQFAGVSSALAVATITPNVGVAVGGFPITSDGVLGLWTLGDAALGIDVPPETLFSGVAGNGVCSPMTMFVDNSVATISAVGQVTPDPSALDSGVTLVSQAGQLATSSFFVLQGLAATGAYASTREGLLTSMGQVSATGYSGVIADSVGSAVAGTYAVLAPGVVGAKDPSQRLIGCATTGAPGTFLSHTPSSAFALWGAPVPGGSASVAFAGLPSVTLTVGTGQTTAQIASALAALINGNSALATAGVTARTVGNLVELHQPQPATISSSVSLTGT